jgi:hypothetical protein
VLTGDLVLGRPHLRDVIELHRCVRACMHACIRVHIIHVCVYIYSLCVCVYRTITPRPPPSPPTKQPHTTTHPQTYPKTKHPHTHLSPHKQTHTKHTPLPPPKKITHIHRTKRSDATFLFKKVLTQGALAALDSAGKGGGGGRGKKKGGTAPLVSATAMASLVVRACMILHTYEHTCTQ